MSIVCLCLLAMAQAQTGSVSSRQLSPSEAENVFHPALREELGILFPVSEVFSYQDKTGKYYLVLTGKIYDRRESVLNDSLRAYCFLVENGKMTRKWSMLDFRRQDESAEDWESSVWFWTEYIQLKDIDGDGEIDPLLVYGTSGANGSDDGRLKILVYHKGQKRALRHQSGVLDFERNIQVDATFYTLPSKIILLVQRLMKQIADEQNIIFPYGYEEKMAKKAVKIDEND